jgi:K+-transporting ATPase KdpF subunit
LFDARSAAKRDGLQLSSNRSSQGHLRHARSIDARNRGDVCCELLVVDRVERRSYGRQTVNGSEVIGLVLSVGLLVYLTIALLKPEWFA